MDLSLNLEKIAELNKNSLAEHLGIEFIDSGEDFIKAKMPVDRRTKQPFGILHGGSSVAFAETLGSVASYKLVGESGKMAVGLEINANHIRPISEGFVFGIVRPIHIGRKTHLWNIEITDKEGKIICVSRLTIMILA